MNQKYKFVLFISCIFLYSFFSSSCTNSPLLVPSPVPTFSQSPSLTRTNTPSTATAILATSTMNIKTIILTPDDLFALPGLEEWSTPDSDDFCEHLPQPQIVINPDKFSLLSGRFVLCIYERINTAMDLDTGNLVSSDDREGDIVLGSSRWWTSENPRYGMFGWNKANFSDAYVLEEYANHSGANSLSYEYCERKLRDQTDRGGMNVEVGKIACVKTTEGKIALVRVEKIYPAVTLSVEFSYSILSNE